MKLISGTTLVAILVLVLSDKTKAQTRIGGGIAYGTEIESVGIVLNSEFFVTDEISIAPDFIYFFPKTDNFTILTTSTEIKQTLWELNVNGHYYFMEEPVQLYGLAGLNYSNVTVKVEISDPTFGTSSSSASDGEIGLNFGYWGKLCYGRKPVTVCRNQIHPWQYRSIGVGGWGAVST